MENWQNKKVLETAHLFLILFDLSIHQSPAQQLKLCQKTIAITWLTM
jgi:hypothetical protein